MTDARKARETQRIRSGYYHDHNYTWQYVLQPGEDPSLLCREIAGKLRQISPFVPQNNNWTDFILFKQGPTGGDCDASAAAILTFQMAYPYLSTGRLEPLPGKYQEYKITLDDLCCCGETMTSGWTPLKRYLAYLHDALRDKKDPRFAPMDRWIKVKKPGLPMTNPRRDNQRSFRSYCYFYADEMAVPVGQILSKDCLLFLKNVWSPGNMLPVPEGFNTARFSSSYGDTADRLLTYLYYFMVSGDDIYLELLLSNEKKTETRCAIMEATKAWLHHVCGEPLDKRAWNTFVEIHCLQPLCRLQNGVYLPICLFNGKPLRYPKPVPRQLKFLPDSLEESEYLFRTCNRVIPERTRLIQQRISLS